MGCWDIFVFGQVTKNEYIQYLYSAWLQGTNILDIRIRKRSEYENIRYSYVVKSYYEDIRSCRPWPTGSRNCSYIYMHKYVTHFVENLLYGVIKSLHSTYSIFISVHIAQNKYTQYSYLVRYLATNIFDIHIWPVARNQYVLYLYLVSCQDINVFNICIQ